MFRPSEAADLSTNPKAECSTGPISLWVPEGHSRFNGLLVKLQKRLSNRVQFTASYALEKLTYEVTGIV